MRRVIGALRTGILPLLDIGIQFEPRDLWIGVYWTSRDIHESDVPLVVKHRLDVYVCLLPMLPIKLTFGCDIKIPLVDLPLPRKVVTQCPYCSAMNSISTYNPAMLQGIECYNCHKVSLSSFPTVAS